MFVTMRNPMTRILFSMALLVGMPQASSANAEAPVCALVGPCGDVNASGTVTSSDALNVLREAVGLSPGLVCQCAGADAQVEFEVDEPLVPTSGTYRLAARFPGLADQSQQWAMLSDPAVGSVSEAGLYTAGPEPGEDVVEVTSVADPSVKRQLTVRVLASDKLQIFWSNSNIGGVDNGGTTPYIPVYAPVALSSMTTYHWNAGSGSAWVGTLGLKRVEDGTVYGPWQATGSPGVDTFPYLYWTVNLGGLVIPAGTYEVLDSDPDTWSQNSGTGGAGMVWFYEWNLP